MAVSIANEKDVTPEYVSGEARDMWKKVRQTRAQKPEEVDALFHRLWKEHPQFCQAYPIVIGEMVQGRFHQKAFEKYLLYLSKNTWASSKDAWLRAQAHYNCILYKHIVPHYNIKDANAAEEHAYQALKKEDASWEQNAAAVQREIEEEKQQIASLKREELKKYIAKLKGDLPSDKCDDERDDEHDNGQNNGHAAIEDTKNQDD